MRQNTRGSGYFERTPEDKKGVTVPRWFIVLGLILAIALFILWFFTLAPWLQVKDIRIEGDVAEASKAEIEKLRGQNILWLSVTKPEEVIKSREPNIEEIQILRGLPDTLRVRLIEREPAIAWQTGDSWFIADQSGFVFNEQSLTRKPDGQFDLPSTNLPVVLDTKGLQTSVGQIVVRPQFIDFVRGLYERLPKEVNVRFIRAEVPETTFNVTVVTDVGWNILFDTNRPIDVQLRTLIKVLESKRGEIHEYVDVRVRGWVYYK